MGRELRSIALRPDEFEQAVKAHFARQAAPTVAADAITAVEVSRGPDISADIKLANPLLDGRESIRLESAEIIALIIDFVRDLGHPLPRLGKKTLAWLDDELALMIELDWF